MTVNNTCVTGGEDCSPSGSKVALPASLTVVFLLLVVIAGIIAYKFRSKLRNRLQFGERRSQTKKEEDCAEDIPVARHQYRPTGMSRDESTGQTPIYENMTAQGAKYNKCRVNQSRLPYEPEDGLYLQCDLQDDAIYSNDPACNPSVLANSHEEDVYVVPDS